ncbi:hypothetical protein [Paenibacillus sp. FSL H7-0331]|uniref:hypothetical protein n=1 Tax=Paenibacillus sp. FSL H7-0331 TaxID=1920421 RepID=UPI003558D985
MEQWQKNGSVRIVCEGAGFRFSPDCSKLLPDLLKKLCDEVSTLDWRVALQQLVDLIQEVATMASKKISKWIKCQLQQWIAGLRSYLKAYLPISSCEV